jgi:DNA-binding response OmpR family regulator
MPDVHGTLVAVHDGVAVSSNMSPVSGMKVLIVSSDDETVDGTYEYLRRVGASPQSVANLTDAIGSAENAHAVIFFADDYSKESALEALMQFRKRHAAKVVVVVSDQVEAFASIGAGEMQGCVTVLRRPTWGWMLLDAIRSQLGPVRASESG